MNAPDCPFPRIQAKHLFFLLFLLFLPVSFTGVLPLTALAGSPEAEAVMPPDFSVAPGFYEEEQCLTLTSPDGYDIYYTCDGSLPSPDSENTARYTVPIILTDVRADSKKVMAGNVVRAICVAPDSQISRVASCTYFIGKNVTSAYRVPVISLITDYQNLYDAASGIFKHPEQRGKAWECPMHFEYFEPNGSLGMEINCGARVHGGASRDIPMKSLRLYARSEYDAQKNFKYDFFSDGLIPAVDVNGNPIVKFKRLLLRGAGNEATAWERTYYRDALIASTMYGTRLDIQSAQPAVVFLNGRYYGIMNLRERLDERYIENHYGIDSEQVAIYDFWYNEDGELQVDANAEAEGFSEIANAYYLEAYHFATTADLTREENYARVCEYFDIPNYIDYLCVELFSGNDDWPGNNCRAWNYMGDDTGAYGTDGKIRWMLYDTEFGFGLYGNLPQDDPIANAICATSKEWPNQKGSTLLFRSLLKNEAFEKAFLSRMLDLMNENFRSDALLKRSKEFAAIYSPLIYENRFSGNQFNDYNKNVRLVNDYIMKRAAGIYSALQKHFEMGTRFQLRIDFNSIQGSLQINSLNVDATANSFANGSFSGTYYSSCPVTVTAIPAPGYRFAGFEGNLPNTAGADTCTGNVLLLTNPEQRTSITLKAVFEKVAEPSYIPQIGSGAASPDVPENEAETVLVYILLGILLFFAIGILLARKKGNN